MRRISVISYRKITSCAPRRSVVIFAIMKQYVIDELTRDDYEKLRAYLDETYGDSGVGGIYWLPLAEEMLDGLQSAHETCKPYYFAIELTPDRLSCELLVRTSERLHCPCMAYAAEEQRNWLIAVADAMLEKLGIQV